MLIILINKIKRYYYKITAFSKYIALFCRTYLKNITCRISSFYILTHDHKWKKAIKATIHQNAYQIRVCANEDDHRSGEDDHRSGEDDYRRGVWMLPDSEEHYRNNDEFLLINEWLFRIGKGMLNSSEDVLLNNVWTYR